MKTVNTLKEFMALPIGTKLYDPSSADQINAFMYAGINPIGKEYIMLSHVNSATSMHSEYRGEKHLKKPYYLDYKEACTVLLQNAQERVQSIVEIYIKDH